MERDVLVLRIDPDLQKLVQPLSRPSFERLENSILTEGCKEPLLVWGDLIIDGFNRHKICTEHGIPFNIKKAYFRSRDEAIVWICATQLKRTDIMEEARRYLIGMQFEHEKVLLKATRPPRNRFATVGEAPERGRNSNHLTATRIADENHVSYATVAKYGSYMKAIEAIREKSPELAQRILSGRYKLSHNALMDLVRLSAEEIAHVNAKLNKSTSPYAQYNSNASRGRHSNSMVSSIKEMPAFDPDASITELSLTIPTWVGSIERTMKNTDLSIVSDSARKKLILMLASIIDVAQNFKAQAEED